MSYSRGPWQQPEIVTFASGGRDAQLIPRQSRKTHRVSAGAAPVSSATRAIIPIDTPPYGNILQERRPPINHHQRRCSNTSYPYPYPLGSLNHKHQQQYPSGFSPVQYETPSHSLPRNPTRHSSHSTSTVTYLYPDGSTGRTPVRSPTFATPGWPITQEVPLTSYPPVRFQPEIALNRARNERDGPTNHTRVPQAKHSETDGKTDKSCMDGKFRHKTITFQAAHFPEVGVRVGDLLQRESPLVVGCNDRVLDLGNREIKVKILWPGYKPFEKRLKTHSGTLDRATLVTLLGNMVYNFASNIKRAGAPIERGYEEWAIGPQPGGHKGISPRTLFITALKHRGGSAWQPELWAPRAKF